MSTNIAILFYGKKAKATTDGLIPIYLRVTINGQRFEISTKRYVEESKWSSEAGRVRANTSDAQMINTFLDTLRNKVYDIQRELLQSDMLFNVETFRNKWLDITNKPKMLFEVFQYHNDQVEKLVGRDFAPATFDRYKTSMQHTKDFVMWKYKVSDLDVKKLNYEFITDFEFWLKSVQNCAHNTSMKYISNFKKIILICLKNGWLDKDPFFGYKKYLKEVIREYLNEDEIQSIIDKQFSTERLNQVKDIFVFSCFTGLAYADVQKLKRTEIVQGIDGEKWIYTQRKKTDTVSRIPILQSAQAILDKYKNHPQCLNRPLRKIV